MTFKPDAAITQVADQSSAYIYAQIAGDTWSSLRDASKLNANSNKADLHEGLPKVELASAQVIQSGEELMADELLKLVSETSDSTAAFDAFQSFMKANGEAMWVDAAATEGEQSALDRMADVLNDKFQNTDYLFSAETFRFGEDGLGEIIMEHRQDPSLNSRFLIKGAE